MKCVSYIRLLLINKCVWRWNPANRLDVQRSSYFHIVTPYSRIAPAAVASSQNIFTRVSSISEYSVSSVQHCDSNPAARGCTPATPAHHEKVSTCHNTLYQVCVCSVFND